MSDNTEVTPPKAAPARIEVKIGDKTKVVFMSFALLTELTPLVGGPERIAEFDFDAAIREHATLLCIGDRDERRKLIPEQLIPEDLEFEQAERLMDWVKEHVFGFFIRRLLVTIKSFDEHKDALKISASLVRNQTG